MLWETPSCLCSMSSTQLTQYSSRCCCNHSKRSNTKRCLPGTQFQSMHWPSNSVFFTEVQCPVIWPCSSIQGSTNYVSSCSTVVEAYSSERFGFPYLSLLGQWHNHRWSECGAAQLHRCSTGREGFYRRKESEVVETACRASSVLVVGSQTGPSGAAFLCCSRARILHSISCIRSSARSCT